MPRKSNYVPSKVQTKVECFICHKDMSNGLDHHHCIPGRNRKRCDDLGLWVWLCRPCHTALHDHGLYDHEIRAIAQQTYITEKKKEGYPEDVAKELWLQEFGKFYDYEDGK